MNRLPLSKHHGYGNDFLVCFDPALDDGVRATTTPDATPVATDRLTAWVRRVCDRRRGVGADGLLVGSPSDDHDARMVLFNADGSRAEMSGNGIRCFAQALAARLGGDGDLRIATDAGTRAVTVTPTEDPSTVRARVDMGELVLLPAPDGWDGLGTHPDRPVLHVDVGNPHSVVGVDDVGVVDLAALGSQVPEVNLEIVEPGPEPHAVTMRVHERGVGITPACGTGACAVAWAATTWGLVGRATTEVVVHMDGGSASVAFLPGDPPRAVLTGPATWIADVEVPAP